MLQKWYRKNVQNNMNVRFMNEFIINLTSSWILISLLYSMFFFNLSIDKKCNFLGEKK